MSGTEFFSRTLFQTSLSPWNELKSKIQCLIFCHQIVAVEPFNVNISSKRFNIRLIAVGFFNLNVFVVRHFAMDFSSQTCLLTFSCFFFSCQISIVSLSIVNFFSSNSLLLNFLQLELKLPLLIFFFAEILTAGILAISFLFCRFSISDILSRTISQTHFSLSHFCCKTNSCLSLWR